MTISLKTFACAAALIGAVALGGATSAFAQANVMRECGAEWQAAKTANTTGGKTWQEFLGECRTRKAAAPATAPAAAPAAPAAAAPAAPAARRPAATAAAGAVPAGVVLPRAVDPKYASLSPGRARMKTCADQWQANKAAGGAGNGALRYIAKDGYWPLCNKRLKGEI